MPAYHKAKEQHGSSAGMRTQSRSALLRALFRALACLVFSTAVLPYSSVADAAIYYVATTGNDANAGTESQPWRTIQKCWNIAVAGDTCRVRGGTYFRDGKAGGGTSNNGFSLQPANSGTAGSPIVLENYPGERPVLDFGNAPGDCNALGFTGCWWGIGLPAGKHYITIRGLEIKNAVIGIRTHRGSPERVGLVVEDNYIHHIHGINTAGQNSACVRADDTVGAIFRRNRCHDVPAGHFLESYEQRDALIEHNVVTPPMGGNGVYHKKAHVECCGSIVRFNYFEIGGAPLSADHSQGCLQLNIAASGNPAHQKQYFYGNVCKNPVFHGVFNFPVGAGTTGTGLYVYNNTFDVRGDCLHNRQTVNVHFYNNICRTESATGDQVIRTDGSAAVFGTVDYNLCHPVCAWTLNYTEPGTTRYATLSAWQAATPHDDHSLTSDPLFISGTYELQAGSPARNAGRSGGTPTGMVVDIGAPNLANLEPPPAAPRNLVVR